MKVKCGVHGETYSPPPQPITIINHYTYSVSYPSNKIYMAYNSVINAATVLPSSGIDKARPAECFQLYCFFVFFWPVNMVNKKPNKSVTGGLT